MSSCSRSADILQQNSEMGLNFDVPDPLPDFRFSFGVKAVRLLGDYEYGGLYIF